MRVTKTKEGTYVAGVYFQLPVTLIRKIREKAKEEQRSITTIVTALLHAGLRGEENQ